MRKHSLVMAAVGVGATAVLVAGTTGDAFALTATKTTIVHSSHTQPSVISTTGTVAPPPGNTPKVVVRLFKKTSSGYWTLVDRTKATWGTANDQSRYFSAGMSPAPTTGECKLVAKYAGNDTLAKSKDTSIIDCRSAVEH